MAISMPGVLATAILILGLTPGETKPRCVFARAPGSDDSPRHAPVTPHRSLLQESCGFSFANTPISFAACQNATGALLWDFNILWSTEDDGNTTSTFRGAIDAASSPEIRWVSFGFPAAGETGMVGGSAYAESYFLGGKSTSDVTPPGHLEVTFVEAALHNGRLQAVFELVLPEGGTQQSQDVLYAAGPLSSDGGLEEHQYYSTGVLDINKGLVSSLGPDLAPAPSAPPSVLAAPAPVLDGPAPAPGPQKQSGCGLSFANEAISLAACQNITAEMTWDYNILWSILDAPNGGPNSTLRGAIDVAAFPEIPSAVHYAAFGFPAAGQTGMVGGSAIIAKTCRECPSGASVDQYYLGGYTSAVVQPPGRLTVLSMEAAFSNGRLQAVFDISVPLAGAQLAEPANVLYAAGPTYFGTILMFHTYYTEGTLALDSGLVHSLGPSIAPAASTPKLAPEEAYAPSTVSATAAPPLAPAPADSACGLSFANRPVSFAVCESKAAQMFWDYNILWSVEDEEPGSRLRGAIDVAGFDVRSSVQWAGFGFPAAGDTLMIGGSAVIVKACSTCASGASIDSYYLGGFKPSTVVPPGHLNVTSAAAAFSDGRLQAIFEILLPQSGAELAQSAPVLYAAGPLDETGGLMDHTFRAQDNLTLSKGLVPELGPETAPGLAPLASAAPPPAITLAPAAAPGDCTLEFAGNNTRLAFAQCQSLATSGAANAGFRLLWDLSQDPGGNGSVMSGALEAGGTGWASFGIPSKPGIMAGANAIIVKQCTTCPTGASADKYLLGGYSTGDVKAGTGQLNVTGLQAAKTPSGVLQAVFQLHLSADALSAPLDLIAAIGPVDSSSNLQTHPLSTSYSQKVNLASGTLSAGSSSSEDSKPTIHGYLMIFGWGLLLPLGVVFARCKEWGPLWFHLHRFTQLLGYLTGMAGAGVAVAMGRKSRTDLEDTHRIIGLVVTIVLSIQILAILWRPAPETRYRFIFNYYHWLLGGSGILLAVSNVFIGLKVAGKPKKWDGLYGAAFGLIVLLWAGKAAWNVTVLSKRKGQADKAEILHSANGTNGRKEPKTNGNYGNLAAEEPPA